jgi:hypothetical protein
MLNAYNSVAQAMGPHAQANALRGMQEDVMDAYARENQSRVIQERERQQREHEKEMERMRIDVLMQRLSQASRGGAYTESRPSWGGRKATTTWYPNGGFRNRVG